MPQINFPYNLTDGTKAMSAQVMSNLNALKDALNSGIGSDNLADLIISTQKIIDLAVTTAKIADSAIVTTKLADLNVTTGKLADLAVTTGKLGDLSIITSKINDLAVTTIKLADDSVIRAKLSPALRTELDSLQSQITDHSNSGDHDNRYYKKTELQSVSSGSSGADKIGATPISTSPSTVQGILNWLKQQIDIMVLGQIPDGSITDNKLGVDNRVGSLAELSTTIKNSIVGAINWLKAQLDTTNSTVSTHLANEANKHKASNIAVVDTSNKFTGVNVEAVLLELFTLANNGKTDIASVVGSPALSSDTFAQLKTYIQNNKNTLATNLTAKAQSSVGTETLANLVAKVGNIATGKRWADGNITHSTTATTKLTVTGLNFTPTWVILSITNNSALYSNARSSFVVLVNNTSKIFISDTSSVVSGYYGIDSYSANSSIAVSSNGITANGFDYNPYAFSYTPALSGRNAVYYWLAIE